MRLAPQVRRVTAPNPSPMTFTGTQSYIVGEGEVAVIDPGPASDDQLKALLGALAPGERVGAILVTHTHVDHSPGVAALKAATGAPTYGFGRHGAGSSAMMRDLAASGAEFGGGEGADHDFTPDEVMADGAVLEIGGARLTAIHTPGHLSNHLAFDLAGAGVFSGDLVMGWATTLVSPPEGDMAAFMASLDRMAARGDAVFWPGHGHPVTDPSGMIAYQAEHRRGREAQIVAGLNEMGAATPAALTAAIYADVDPRLHGAAARNVFSHLLGLIAEGRVEAEGAITPGARFHLIRG
ncbi:MBL fold metallo-hydrolase [Pikeienuella sp. HZG-20]|uniref:MBL fold metallo-hydrolase n=1 Tax=Paludibacillus litoralis TaxID=3133267 RepID=UPI0030EB58D0